MRLQIAIHRHSLPPVRLLFNTDSSPNPSCPKIITISDLLTALNSVVPLESSDGEWGLEDYLVEVAATADQEHGYECFHYQTVTDVLREDDEVIVRGLTSEELRDRRIGGRFQITSDGRHLIDGLSWGRRWRAAYARPGITIPPRKRRKIEHGSDGDERLQLEYPPTALLHEPSRHSTSKEQDKDDEDDDDEDDDDDDSDEDFVDDAEEDEDEEDSDAETEELLENVTEGEQISDGAFEFDNKENKKPLEITAHAHFVDAEEADEIDKNNKPNDKSAHLGKAESLRKEPSILEVPQIATRHKRKRSSDATEKPEIGNADQSAFEGFSSPKTTPEKATASKDEESSHVGSRIVGKLGQYPVEKVLGVEDQSLSESAPDQSRGEANNVLASHEALESEPDEATSSSSESQPDTENDPDSDSESGASSDDSSDDSISESSSDEDTSSDSERETSPASTFLRPVEIEAKTEVQVSKPVIEKKVVESGKGTIRTQYNNSRTRMKRQLKRLKDQGKLPADANLSILKAYLATHPTEDTNNATQEESVKQVDESTLLARKQNLMAKIYQQYGSDTANGVSVELDEPPQPDVFAEKGNGDRHTGTASGEEPLTQAASSAAANTVSHTGPSQSQPQPKRTKLDLESSRRMLFSSLGVRNPTTPAAEEAVREKLSRSVRTVVSKKDNQQEAGAASKPQTEDVSWKEKLIVMAVECVQPDRTIKPPPFPFQQPWQIKKIEESQPRQESVIENDVELSYDKPIGVTTDTSGSSEPPPELQKHSDLTSVQASDHVDLNLTDWPVVTEFSGLPDLAKDNIQVGSIIAYKELWINARVEPEESSYRVARVLSIEDDFIQVVLAPEHRLQQISQTDPDVEPNAFKNFEMPMEDIEPDSGTRELAIDEMRDPKIIRAACVLTGQTPKHNSPTREENTKQNSNDEELVSVVPESVPQISPSFSHSVQSAAEIDTPRRDEITTLIKEAGFDSELDEQLLHPIDRPQSDHRSEIPKLAPRTNSSQFSDVVPPKVESRLRGGDVTNQSNGQLLSSAALENQDSQTSEQQTSSGLIDSISYGVTSSSPSESIVNSVDYPHVSHLDMNESTLLAANSSSHQDAQRVSPLVVMDENGVPDARLVVNETKAEVANHDSEQDEDADLMASEVPQSQDVSAQATDHAQNSSFNGFGLDGPSEIMAESDEESVDSNGLPSLRFLTSSQGSKRQTPSFESRDRTTESSRTFPKTPPTKAFRTGNRPPSSSSEHESRAEPDLPDLPTSSQVVIKASQSDREPRLSQIPAGSQIVDLTLTSSVADDQDGDPHDRQDNHNLNTDSNDEEEWDASILSQGSQTRSSNRRGRGASHTRGTSLAKKTSSLSSTSASTSKPGPSSKSTSTQKIEPQNQVQESDRTSKSSSRSKPKSRPKPLDGLGSRRMLVNRKTKSQI